PKVAHDICALYFEGKAAESAKLQLDYLKLCNDLFIEVNPIPVKEALEIMGYDVGKCRMPLCSLEPAHRAALTETLKAYGLVK
ncbi:MAG: dihydrodipicolinate synthase family protein, partial [Clostridia bacterium]|nr:dihydrodipicolinate synthase family protein [Clostridia bacterium]